MSSSSSNAKAATAGVAVEELTEEEKILNIDDLDQSLWLVKVPQFVAEQWSLANNDDILGSLRVIVKPKSTNNPATKQLSMKLDFPNAAGVPSEFTLDDQSDLKVSQDTFVAFSTENGSKRLCIDGRVTKNMQLRPQPSAQFGQLIRERGNQYKKKHEMHVANVADIQKASTQSQLVEFVGNEQKAELKRKSKSSSSTALGAAAPVPEAVVAANLRSRMFEVFHKNPKMAYKEIRQSCVDVPGFVKETQLRRVLEEYTMYHGKGTDKNYYELKPEYRDHSIK